MTDHGRGEAPVLAAIRTILVAIFLFGAIGVAAELLLLEHTEDIWQWVPLVLLGASVPAAAWSIAQRNPASLRTFQAVMVLFLFSGVVGVALHYRGNAEFELEMYPSLRGFGLVGEALMGATPALAPGTMLQLGLLGLASTYRHPALARRPRAIIDDDAGAD